MWVTFNGEIYNFKELRRSLERLGHQFKTDSDTEVIAHAYEEYKEECFKDFNGMFAIGIWDELNHRLILARDRLGKKPLYYTSMNGTFLFASELKAILAYPHFARKIDHLSLLKYLFYEFVPSPHTIFAENEETSVRFLSHLERWKSERKPILVSLRFGIVQAKILPSQTQR